MKLLVLALDYDGTIAVDGRLDPEVAALLPELRERGLVLVLVTGRILGDLRCRLPSLRDFDAVVAENGAVLAFPRSGTSRLLAPAPRPELLAELRTRAIDHLAGQSVVECDAVHAHTVLAIIRKLELPLVLHFNRGRLMILPQAVSKATGLKEALRTLRFSAHNALAIGDAENDHELLSACEVGVAVAWGSAALRGVADQVLAGRGPADVATFLRARAEAPERRLPPSKRHRLLLGRSEDGSQAFLNVRGRNVLVTGDPLSGKSWLAGLLAEQLVLQGYSVCVVDPEGDYGDLATLPGMRVLGGDDPLPGARELSRHFAVADAGAVIDLSRCPNSDKPSYVRWLFAQLADLRRRTGLPHRVVIDEAHYFLHEAPAGAARDLELGGCTLVSYQASRLHPGLLATCEVIFVTRETDAREAELLRELCVERGVPPTQDEEAWAQTLANLELNSAVLLPGADESGERLLTFSLAPRLTRHVRHEHKYLDAPLADTLAFRFRPDGRLGGRAARSLREFTDLLECAKASDIEEHLQRGDFSRWISEVFRDPALAERMSELEELYRSGRLADVNGALVHAVHERYRTVEGDESAATRTSAPARI